MKKLISSILILCLSTIAMADPNCNWSTIKTLPDGGYEYSPSLNLCVGNLIQTNKTQSAQIVDLTKAIELKDLALTAADSRTQIWETTSLAEQDRLTKISTEQKDNNFLYFGLGILSTVLTGFAVAKLVGK